MAARFYLLVFVVMSGLFGMVSQPDLPFAIAQAQTTQDRKTEADNLNQIALQQLNKGQLKEALATFQQILVIRQEIKDRLGEGLTLIGIGLIYDKVGKYPKALTYYQQALAIVKEIGDRTVEGTALNNIGSVYLSLGQYPKALEYYEQSLTIRKEVKDRDGEEITLSNIGLVYDKLGKSLKALVYYQQALAIAKALGDRDGEGTTLNNIGAIYQKNGKYSEALAYFLQAMTIAKALGDRDGEGTTLSNIGLSYQKSGRYSEALMYFQQALAIKTEIGDRAGEGTILSNIGDALNSQSQTDLAVLFFKQSVNTRESIRKDLKKLSRDEQQSYTRTVAATYRLLANLLLKQGRVTEALQVLDLLKIQELEDYLKNVKGNDRTAKGVELLEPERVISGQLSAISYEKIPELNRNLANKIQQLPKSEINKVPDYLQKLPQGAVLIYPLILDDRLEIIIFSANSLPINRTVPIKKAELEKLVGDYRSDLQDSSSIDVKNSSKKLYDILIQPIAADLKNAKATTILYAPDGILRYIPLAALYDGNQWLVEQYRISNLIAYSLTDFTPKAKTKPSVLAGAFGGKASDRKFGQTGLPATLKEVQAIADSLQNSTTLEENNFSRKAIEAQIPKHNILHLATHASFNTGKPDNSFIIFGNGDLLRLSEIPDLQMPNIDLIVLSACQTGVGKLGDGVEILGFGYQVQKAGAKAAIASLWSVSDDGTQALMQVLYEQVKQGEVTISESLRRSQIALIRDKKFSHPFYWSAFIAIGNGL